jgi:A/G-specific adenine glycosylase
VAVSVRARDAAFARALIDWQRRHGRHDLPWQGTRDAYRIWVSEIMLQQTQVATVVPYYRRFLERFPDVCALAAADEDEVLRLWSGLGYYSRARHLHRAARLVCERHGGRFPGTLAQMAALPGVGRSTAAAVLVFSRGAREAILDGNVKRVLARCFAIAGYPGDKRVADALWRRAEALLPARGIETYTQALMDLGAGVCTRARPRCGECPLAAHCRARAEGRIAELPGRRPRRALPLRSTVMLVLQRAGEVMLEKRPAPGVWGGLWCFPEAAPGEDVAALCAARYGLRAEALAPLPPVEHGFTHFRLTILPQPLRVTAATPAAPAPGRVWLAPEDARTAAVPVPVRRILDRLPRVDAAARRPRRRG